MASAVLRAVGLLNVPVVLIAVGVSAQTTVIGRIIDDAGVPVRGATIHVRGALATIMVAADRRGSFRAQLESSDESVSVTIKATGFGTRERTLVVRDRVANAETIVMSRQRVIKAEGLVALIAANDESTLVDVHLTNLLNEPTRIDSVSLAAVARQSTDCAHVEPAVRFVVRDSLRASRVPVDVSGATPAPHDTILAEGQFLELPCRQQRLDIRITYSFVLAPREYCKVRIVVPSKIQTTNAQVRVPLASFYSIAVAFKADGGDAHASRLLSSGIHE